MASDLQGLTSANGDPDSALSSPLGCQPQAPAAHSPGLCLTQVLA